MTLDGNQIWHLQLVGRWTDHDQQNGRPRSIGPRIFLQPGTLTDTGNGLGFTNQTALALPAEALVNPWLLEGYELWDSPDRGAQVICMPLVQPQLIHRPQMELLPPCAIQPDRDRQPSFELSRIDRNPCPGWSERIHLYQNPGKPFDASAVVYLNGQGQIAAAELFQVPLRSGQHDGALVPQRRAWIRFSY